MAATFPPPWASSMIQNYRAFYKKKYTVDSKLSDTDIWDITNSVFDDSDNQNQDNERVSEMYLREHGNAGTA